MSFDFDAVNSAFKEEFGHTSDRFSIVHLKIAEAMTTADPIANRPGAYLFWHPQYSVVMVGKHQANSKMRALQHIRDNTKNETVALGTLKNDPELDLYLFNVANDRDKHWVLALEAFFEWNIKPVIRAHRMG